MADRIIVVNKETTRTVHPAPRTVYIERPPRPPSNNGSNDGVGCLWFFIILFGSISFLKAVGDGKVTDVGSFFAFLVGSFIASAIVCFVIGAILGGMYDAAKGK